MEIHSREDIADMIGVLREMFSDHMADHIVGVADGLAEEDFGQIDFHMTQLREHHEQLVEAVAGAMVSQIAHRAIDNEVDGFDVPDDLSELDGD